MHACRSVPLTPAFPLIPLDWSGRLDWDRSHTSRHDGAARASSHTGAGKGGGSAGAEKNLAKAAQVEEEAALIADTLRGLMVIRSVI